MGLSEPGELYMMSRQWQEQSKLSWMSLMMVIVSMQASAGSIVKEMKKKELILTIWSMQELAVIDPSPSSVYRAHFA